MSRHMQDSPEIKGPSLIDPQFPGISNLLLSGGLKKSYSSKEINFLAMQISLLTET